MRTHVRHSRGDSTQPAVEEDHERADAFDTAAPDAEEAFDEEGEEVYDILRVHCPDCARPIALFAGEELLPEHALCPTPWNPFGLTVCPGSGRALRDAEPVDGMEYSAEDLGTLLTLPAGLDWRTQPFSHAAGPESRPVRVPRQRAA
ncbi:hypothetical protein QMK19_17370 [Streptomyces sp. H10-C2]|uniref:hypothetical protein n=1 Tax=unclassified Streptomyces TaxID=2593676 RepID=UPI0024B96BAF|nr:MULTISPECIES: hypothetical protein [unclassified Streptomyces]MDJ0345582.1 hypothetical protein [Streptomyces sp. PH10-H1]MDJ0371405.1 hypothetical protein [Streptomyces sp. H10-C2]